MEKKRGIIAAFLAAVVIFSGVLFMPPGNAPLSAGETDPDTGRYIPGGRNVVSAGYVNTPGFPPFADKAKWAGTVSGSWQDMGRRLGETCSAYIQYSTDIWWPKVCDTKGYEATLSAMKLYAEQIEALDPNQIDFLKGIAAGAGALLGRSAYADRGSELYAEDFTRVLCACIWDVWFWGDPASPGVSGGVQGPAGCNGFAVRGPATVDGKTITMHLRHTPHAGLVYQTAYVLKPEKGNAVWTVGHLPGTSGLMLVNSKGVSITHHFGGATNPGSLEYPGGPYTACTFGVPWLNVLLYAAVNADTAEEAITLLTLGPEEYREKTGRATLLRDGAWNWMVADADTMAVVEVAAERYAVRYPGQFTGPDFTDKNYIVVANHFLCDHSYDKNNRRTDIPMTIFNVNSGSVERFWTLMWELRERYGHIDRYMAQHIVKTTYIRDRDTGKKIYSAPNDQGEYVPYAYALRGVQGSMIQEGRKNGTNAAKMAILEGEHSMTFWTLGNPSDWEGAWDEFHFHKGSSE